MIPQISPSSTCTIPNGKVAFTQENEQTLNVKVSVTFENCLCKMTKTLNSTQEIKEILQKDPLELYKKLLKKREIPDRFLPFLLIGDSSKITLNHGQCIERHNVSPPKTRGRRASSSSKKKASESKSTSSESPRVGRTLPLELNSLPKEEATESKSRRELGNSTGDLIKSSSKKRTKVFNNSTGDLCSPPDASSDSGKSPKTSPRRVSEEFKKVTILEESPLFNISKLIEGSGQIQLTDDHSLVLRLNYISNDCRYKFKKILSSTLLDVTCQEVKETPTLIFEKVISKKVFSDKFDLFLNASNPFIAKDTLCTMYFENIGVVPRLPKDFEEIWNSNCSFKNGQKVYETQSLYLVFDRINGKEVTILNFSNAIENPRKGHEKQLMRLCYEISLDAFNLRTANAPYWALITNKPIEGLKTYEDQMALLPEHYTPSNLIEAGLYLVWNNQNGSPSKINIRCQEKGRNEQVVFGPGNNSNEIVIKEGVKKSRFEGILGVRRFLK